MRCSQIARWLRPVGFAVVGLAGVGFVPAARAGDDPVLFYGQTTDDAASAGLLGSAQNGIVTIAVPPAAAGTITSITLEGILHEVNGNTYASEACIEVTAPDGAKFVIQPFIEGDFTGTISTDAPVIAPRVVVPIGTRGGGTYTFRFFELFRDNATGADANWTNLFIKFYGGGLPFSTTIVPTAQGPGVVAANWGTVIISGAARSLTIPQTPAAKRVRLKGYATALTGWTSNNSASPQSYVRIDFTAPSATTGLPVNWTVLPLPGATLSTGTFDLTVDIPETVLAGAGYPWSYTVTAPGTGASVGAGIAYLLMNVQPLLPDPPASSDLGFIRGRPALGAQETTVVTTATASVAAQGVKWFRFATEADCSNATGYWLDIHTRRPAGSGVDDHEIGVYRADSSFVATDDDHGAGHWSMLCFGQTSPERANIDVDAAPVARAGQNGVLTAGTYYLAVAEFNAQFGPGGFGVSTTGTDVGAIAVDFRTNLPPVPPPAYNEIGAITPGLLGVNISAFAPGEVVWLRFSLPQAVNAASGRYLDIHTIGASTPASVDTELGLYNSVGVLLVSDDDDGQNGNRSLLTFGGAASRPAVSGSILRDGRDGALAAGTYYLAAGIYNVTFNPPVEWGATSNNTVAVQSYQVTFISGTALACPADLGMQGGVSGQDGLLDNNDFVVYINYFFTSNPLADVGIQGGVAGQDGLFDNNDFVVFIGQFFGGCP